MLAMITTVYKRFLLPKLLLIKNPIPALKILRWFIPKLASTFCSSPPFRNQLINKTYCGVSFSTYPTNPILSLPTLTTLDLTIRGGVLGHFGSWVTFRFETTTVKFSWLRKDTKLSTPSSNSWFPRVCWRKNWVVNYDIARKGHQRICST